MNFNEVLAAAYVRGCLMKDKIGDPKPDFLSGPLENLSEAQIQNAISYGKNSGLKMYRFKEKEDLPRVRKVLGFLKAIQPENLLDVGSGRGVFLFPFLRDFPCTQVTSLDILQHRVDFLQAVRDGGIGTLTALQADICIWDAPDNSYDVVTLLEVLEHIPDHERAVANAVRLCKRYVVVSVPSKPDNNPEHIHLLTQEKLTAAFSQSGAVDLRFGGVNGHLLMIAVKG